MKTILIKNATVVNRGEMLERDIYIRNGMIEKIDTSISKSADITLDAEGKYALPGIIDDQVHFREPGLTHKGTIYSEAKAAVAGGITSFMEMPNTSPPAVTQRLLEDKYEIAAARSLANYSFFMGAANDNLEEVLRTDPRTVCGVKVFMGSSTGAMLVDNAKTLENLFAQCPLLIATHCESEEIVRANMAHYQALLGDRLTAAYHPLIRSREACYASSSSAVELAKKHGTRLHILHISTKEELDLFNNDRPLREKKITSEACVHHLFFDDGDYARLGNLIKCNPAIKTQEDKNALWDAVLDDRLDVIATDHAPHTWEEKERPYAQAPSGLPLVQHALNIMLDFYDKGRITLPRIVEKMCHAPAECFRVDRRGYLEEGYWADLFLLDLKAEWRVGEDNILYQCGWSPLEGMKMKGKVATTIVSGHVAYQDGVFYEEVKGRRLLFK